MHESLGELGALLANIELGGDGMLARLLLWRLLLWRLSSRHVMPFEHTCGPHQPSRVRRADCRSADCVATAIPCSVVVRMRSTSCSAHRRVLCAVGHRPPDPTPS